MKFNEDFHKVKTKSRTAIIFDKNEPIFDISWYMRSIDELPPMKLFKADVFESGNFLFSFGC